MEVESWAEPESETEARLEPEPDAEPDSEPEPGPEPAVTPSTLCTAGDPCSVGFAPPSFEGRCSPVGSSVPHRLDGRGTTDLDGTTEAPAAAEPCEI